MSPGESLLAGLVVVWSLPLLVLAWLVVLYVLKEERDIDPRDRERY